MEWRKGGYAAHTDPSASCPIATEGFVFATPWNTRAEADTLRAEVARLKAALRTMVYEATHLSPEAEDLSHWCKFTGDALQDARAALGHKEANT
tara:strand:- start:886 stop:1167 length:282 start_codon:yes stop_codon:yes gene_type:complete